MKSRTEIEQYYKTGKRFFRNIDFNFGQSFENSNFENAIFEFCYFGIEFNNSNFRNAKFLECNMKSTNFTNCDFSNAEIKENLMEGINFKGSNISNLIFENNISYGAKVKLNSETLEIEYNIHKLNYELYEFIPEFEEISDHSNDEHLYSVFGDLSIVLAKEIIENENLTKLITDSFKFFNYLSDKKDKEIDNLLIVGIYEGIYHSGKCNEIAKKLLNKKAINTYEFNLEKWKK
ncbi:DUF7674 family protein [Lacinutrix mariniflava]|uniref:DUF7674 family protein n=1 Tax=Lacinutrix mariniflava TaxID=342955 RepID=UPI0006E23BB6|nr:pentapeptide repeat-containing protein [Lacinutrix mariniflava]